MKTRIGIFVLICIICSLMLFSCGGSGTAKLQSEVNELSQKMNDGFIEVSNVLKNLDIVFEKLSANASLADIDISDMDEANGGDFYLFREKMYLRRYDPNKDEVLAVFYGALDLTEERKRELLLYLKLESQIIDAVKSTPLIARCTFNSTTNIGIGYPNGDVAAILPPGLDVGVFDWYHLFLEAKDKPVWIETPHVSLGADGWIQSIGSGIYNSDNAIGMLALDVAVLKLANSIIKDAPVDSIIILAYNDSTVFAATQKAKDVLKLKLLQDYDYVEELKTNPKISEEIRLTNMTQADDLQKLGSLINAENIEKDVSITINGKKYSVIINKTSNPEYYILGLK